MYSANFIYLIYDINLDNPINPVSPSTNSPIECKITPTYELYIYIFT